MLTTQINTGVAPKAQRRRRAQKRKVFQVLEEQTLRGREETDSLKSPFRRTFSLLHDALSAPLERSEMRLPCLVEMSLVQSEGTSASHGDSSLMASKASYQGIQSLMKTSHSKVE